jgi:hypothetical protein
MAYKTMYNLEFSDPANVVPPREGAVGFPDRSAGFDVLPGFKNPRSSLSDLGYSLVVARVRAFFTEAQNHEERTNMRYYKLNHPQSRPFVSPTGC